MSVMDEHYVTTNGGGVIHPVSLADESKITNLRSGSWKKCDCICECGSPFNRHTMGKEEHHPVAASPDVGRES